MFLYVCSINSEISERTWTKLLPTNSMSPEMVLGYIVIEAEARGSKWTKLASL